jgi:hypothetical protein
VKFNFFILVFFISNWGHSQNTIEMVPNGDFDKLNQFRLPIKVYKNYFKEKLEPDSWGYYSDHWGNNNCEKKQQKYFLEYRLRDIYGNRPKFGHPEDWFGDGINENLGNDIHSWLILSKSIQVLQNWYPYRNAKIKTVNFDSMVYQDTFHFYLRNQLEHHAINDSWTHCYRGVGDIPVFRQSAKQSKLRVCGQNLYDMASSLSVPTRKGAYYVVNLDLLYDYVTHLNTLMFRKYFLDSNAKIDGVIDKLSALYPMVQINLEVLEDAGSYPFIGELEKYCNITLDSNKFARNNNFKIVLLNKYFEYESNKKQPLVSQEIWDMPLFSETKTVKHFEKHFKANSPLNWIQLKQREPGTVSYYPNDTIRIPNRKDSLLKLITFGGMYHEAPYYDRFNNGFHPTLGHWNRLKQWHYPGKLQRYAQKVLRNADYFLDNLSLKPEMYKKSKIAAPNLLCQSDTFLAFLPSEDIATWTDLKSGKVISRGDSCWIYLTDEVKVEVRTNTFVDTLYYKIQKPNSPFSQLKYTVCLKDTLKFQTPIEYKTSWQFGQIESNRYTHLFTYTSVLQATITVPNGCSYTYDATVVKGPKLNYFTIDTFLCNQNKYLLNIPFDGWKLIPQVGIEKKGTQLELSTKSDVQKLIYFNDSISNCSIQLNVKILSNQTPHLSNDIDTAICYGEVFKYEPTKSQWYLLNGEFTPSKLAIIEAGEYALIAGNRTCADTQLLKITVHPKIKANIVQLNPWTCYLDSQLIFKTSPSKYQYFWDGMQTSDSLYFTQDTQQIQIIVVDSHQCEKNYTVFPLNKCFKPVWIPNVFTPNGQGPNTNELFQAQCASCVITYMRIYNNWGEKIYDGVEPWNGTYQGQIVPNGVYAYTIGVKVSTGSNSILEHFNGSVQVLR